MRQQELSLRKGREFFKTIKTELENKGLSEDDRIAFAFEEGWKIGRIDLRSKIALAIKPDKGESWI